MEDRDSILGRGEIPSFRHHIHICSKAHSASYIKDPGVKRAVREANYSLPSSGELKNVWRFRSRHPCSFMTLSSRAPLLSLSYKLPVYSFFSRMINENELIKNSVTFIGLANCYIS
jgi:hypothetical protein